MPASGNGNCVWQDLHNNYRLRRSAKWHALIAMIPAGFAKVTLIDLGVAVATQ